MAEAGIIAYGIGIGMTITLAAVCFLLRRKEHAKSLEQIKSQTG
ncbi:MAG: hypothetical protein ACR2LL_01410 [Nitrosopumilus sp.]|nr:hypothetical protein [Nitrosopumilus sp.]